MRILIVEDELKLAEIKQVAQDILSSGNSGTNVGNLYFQKYSYCLKDNLSLTIIDNSAKEISLTLDKSSKITLTGDTYVSSLSDEDSTYSNINFNGYKLYVNSKAIN